MADIEAELHISPYRIPVLLLNVDIPESGGAPAVIVTDATTARTLELTDAGVHLRMTSAEANLITVPSNADVAIPVGSQILVVQVGAGQTSFAFVAGVVINAPGGSLEGQGKFAILKKVAEDEWDLFGQLTGDAPASAYVFALDDDDGAVAASLGKPQLPTIAPDYMAFSLVLDERGVSAAALSSKTLEVAGSFALQPGKLVVIGEYACTAAVAADERQRHGLGMVVQSAGVPSALYAVGFGTDTGIPAFTYTFNGGIELGDVQPLAGGAIVGQRVGLYVNSDTGQIYYVNGDGDTGPVTGGLMNTAHRFAPALYVDDDNPENVGATVAGQLYIHAADLTLTYPAGAVDCYGVEI